jgi:Sec-independent protein translocase protein TatA
MEGFGIEKLVLVLVIVLVLFGARRVPEIGASIGPQDDRVDRIRDPAAVVAELREIEDTRGRLDRHARGTSAPPSEITSRSES